MNRKKVSNKFNFIDEIKDLKKDTAKDNIAIKNFLDDNGLDNRSLKMNLRFNKPAGVVQKDIWDEEQPETALDQVNDIYTVKKAVFMASAQGKKNRDMMRGFDHGKRPIGTVDINKELGLNFNGKF
jgi:hypothetical protein